MMGEETLLVREEKKPPSFFDRGSAGTGRAVGGEVDVVEAGVIGVVAVDAPFTGVSTFHNLKPHPPVLTLGLRALCVSGSSPVVIVGGGGSLTVPKPLLVAVGVDTSPTLCSPIKSLSTFTHVSEASLASFDSARSCRVSSSCSFRHSSSRRRFKSSRAVDGFLLGSDWDCSTLGGEPDLPKMEKPRVLTGGWLLLA